MRKLCFAANDINDFMAYRFVKKSKIYVSITAKNMVMPVLLIDMNSEFRTLNKSFSNSLLRCYG